MEMQTVKLTLFVIDEQVLTMQAGALTNVVAKQGQWIEVYSDVPLAATPEALRSLLQPALLAMREHIVQAITHPA